MTRDVTFAPKSNTSRPRKVGEEMRHALSGIFLRGETHIPVLDSASITVSEVRVSPDLRNATVYVMPLAGKSKDVMLRALAEHAPHIRHLLAKRIELRYMPKLHYKLDESFEVAGLVNELLHKSSPNALSEKEKADL